MLRSSLPRLHASRKAPKLAYKSRHISPSQAPSPEKIRRWRRIAKGGAFISAACIFLYPAVVYLSYRKDVKAAQTLDLPNDVSDRYNHIAEEYDSDVNTMEWMMGIRKLRKRLAREARGHVLEMSVGTGRNMDILPLIQNKIKSVTMVDKSPEMIRVARLKWAETNPWFINATFRVHDGAQPVPCPSPQGFDTIIQTMGICSTGEPEKALRNMGRMTNPDGGRILLLEHGRSYYRWVNDWIDGMAPAHANRYGCWFNKDIEAIIKRSGLEIVDRSRVHAGTTYLFELKPSEELVQEGKTTKELAAAMGPNSLESIAVPSNSNNSKLSWLWSWWK